MGWVGWTGGPLVETPGAFVGLWRGRDRGGPVEEEPYGAEVTEDLVEVLVDLGCPLRVGGGPRASRTAQCPVDVGQPSIGWVAGGCVPVGGTRVGDVLQEATHRLSGLVDGPGRVQRAGLVTTVAGQPGPRLGQGGERDAQLLGLASQGTVPTAVVEVAVRSGHGQGCR